MRLFLARHGETDSNLRGLALGRADLPLNERGRRQADRIAKALASEPLAAVYASPLLRAIETAQPIAAGHSLDVQVETRLIEMNIGDMEGLSFAEVRSRYPRLLEKWVGPNGPEMPMPGGERLVDVQQRAWEAYQTITARHSNEDVCLVTHNFVILSLLVTAMNMELAHFRRLRQAVGAFSILDVAPATWRVRVIRLNDTCHLD